METPIFLTGSSGTLGSAFVRSGLVSAVLTPDEHELDITDRQAVMEYVAGYEFTALIHCAALARMVLCEQDPSSAVNVNVQGTCHLVEAVLEKERSTGKTIRFIYISTDGVYNGTQGNYKETDPAVPYNIYGWTKHAAECAVGVLADHCIVRTSFFDPEAIRFDTAAEDAYSSKLPIDELVKALAFLLKSEFTGIINVGGQRLSEYERYKKYKPGIQAVRFKDIAGQAACPLAQDASMDCSVWEKLYHG